MRISLLSEISRNKNLTSFHKVFEIWFWAANEGHVVIKGRIISSVEIMPGSGRPVEVTVGFSDPLFRDYAQCVRSQVHGKYGEIKYVLVVIKKFEDPRVEDLFDFGEKIPCKRENKKCSDRCIMSQSLKSKNDFPLYVCQALSGWNDAESGRMTFLYHLQT